jgi:hypothetical protein
MLAKPLMPKYWKRQAVVEAEGEGPLAEGIDEGNVGVDAEDVSEAPRVEVMVEASCCSLQRY